MAQRLSKYIAVNSGCCRLQCIFMILQKFTTLYANKKREPVLFWIILPYFSLLFVAMTVSAVALSHRYQCDVSCLTGSETFCVNSRFFHRSTPVVGSYLKHFISFCIFSVCILLYKQLQVKTTQRMFSYLWWVFNDFGSVIYVGICAWKRWETSYSQIPIYNMYRINEYSQSPTHTLLTIKRCTIKELTIDK